MNYELLTMSQIGVGIGIAIETEDSEQCTVDRSQSPLNPPEGDLQRK
jgi:hypothetical protein